MKAGFITSADRATARATLTVEQRAPRKDVRISHRVPCRVTLYDAQTGQATAVVGQTVNVSKTGFAVQLNRHVPMGSWMEALVPRLSGDPMFVCGTVVHVRRVLADSYEMGVEFADQTPPAVF